ncbi:hypothetical protein BH24ACT15_BH24ACT15_36680 [soil metagenome]
MSQWTPAYLDSSEHRRLRLLATIHRRSVTDLVREAVSRYLHEESGTDLPSVDEIAIELYGEERYAGVPRGAAGLVARMQIRERGDRPDTNVANGEDHSVGSALSKEHERHVATWRR